MSPYANSAQALRRMRQRIFSYSSKREAQADRVLAYLKMRSLRDPGPVPPAGPYSGLTRPELARTGTCETDWF